MEKEFKNLWLFDRTFIEYERNYTFTKIKFYY